MAGADLRINRGTASAELLVDTPGFVQSND